MEELQASESISIDKKDPMLTRYKFLFLLGLVLVLVALVAYTFHFRASENRRFKELIDKGVRVNGRIVAVESSAGGGKQTYSGGHHPIDITVEYTDGNGKVQSIKETVRIDHEKIASLRNSTVTVFYSESEGELFAATEMNSFVVDLRHDRENQ